jgi:hypothetical protein
MKSTENKIEVTEVEVTNDALEQVELENVKGGTGGNGFINGYSAEVTGVSCNPLDVLSAKIRSFLW